MERVGARMRSQALGIGCLAFLASCAAPPPAASRPAPTSARSVAIYDSQPFFVQEGIASWYGGRWIGRLTANGERYRANDMTAAHKTLPFNTRVRVTDLKTGKQVIVRINNRGPYTRGRIIDLSAVAAKELGIYHRGIAKVRIEAFRQIPLMSKPNLKLPAPTPTPPPPKKSMAESREKKPAALKAGSPR